MQHVHHGTTVSIVRGDITDQEVDAIVNAANRTLLGGGGVDGAIHRKGGPDILAACEAHVAEHGQCDTGAAVTTTAGDLTADVVIHAVGPRYVDGLRGENVQLERVYIAALDRAREAGAKRVAFPAISTGAYGFPVEPAAFIALNTVFRAVGEHPDAFDEIRFVIFGADDLVSWETAFGKVVRTMLG